jgi:hypothetical protein
LVPLLLPVIKNYHGAYKSHHGDDLHDGIAGFGDTAALAIADFNQNFENQTLKRKPFDSSAITDQMIDGKE